MHCHQQEDTKCARFLYKDLLELYKLIETNV